MRTHDNLAVAAGFSVDPGRWLEQFDELMGRIAGRFGRVEPRRRARAFVLGLLSGLRRKNCWTIAEHAGDATPDGMQHLLAGARWDAAAVRDDLRGYVVEQLGDPGAVLVVDETGDLKKGTGSAGVQRQYTGTAGRVENCQLGVFLAYVSPAGRALIDAELYLPRSWTEDRARCAQAGVPAEVGFATKPALAQAMLGRALDAGVPARWVTADEAYGQDHKFRRFCEQRRMGYVVAVPCSQSTGPGTGYGNTGSRADVLAASAPEQAWKRLSAGDGAKGPRLYDWALATLPGEPGEGSGRWLLIRRSITDPAELSYYLCAGPPGTAIGQLVRVAGSRWAIEECFQTAKNETGLDQYQVRRYVSWHRHVTLAMLAAAYLAVTAAASPKAHPAWSGSPQPKSAVSWHT